VPVPTIRPGDDDDDDDGSDDDWEDDWDDEPGRGGDDG
jgi:hypothetical protein